MIHFLWCTFFCVASFAISIAALVLVLNSKESFQNPPKAPDAQSSGLYQTYFRECEPGLTKCEIKTPFQETQYFCSKHSDCQLTNNRVQGKPIKHPDWSTRFG
jgi:hypothetical protein